MPTIPGPIQSTARRLRLISCALGIFAALTPAFAEDFPSPPIPPIAAVPPGSFSVGPATFTRWSGFYLGGDFNYTSTLANFSNATGPLIAASLQDTVVQTQYAPSQLQTLGQASASAFGYGGFVGYNAQWQDVITGIEATYTHTSLSVSSSSSGIVSRSFTPPAGGVTSVAVGPSTGRFDLTDYGEIRGRAGYVVGNLLPYGFVGVVVGIGNYSVSTNVDASCTDATTAPYTPVFTCQGFPLTPSTGQDNALLYGLSIGGGLEWALTPNLFLRSEVEYIQFASISSISVSLFTGRVGVGFKF
ncbi:MAG TPA: outer membrane beta-barrel protein [Xanthobacteraceae bacterium]|nr:outer membrane beta-barrel protein [Xanthobacteraceae bacterium]